jgi:hypothetical protein
VREAGGKSIRRSAPGKCARSKEGKGQRVCRVATSIPAGATAIPGGVGMAPRPAVGSFAASLGVVGVIPSAVQVWDAWRSPSGVLGCEWAASSVLVNSIPDSVRLSSEWCVVEKRKREDLTKPCSRIAMTSCGVDSLLAAIC